MTRRRKSGSTPIRRIGLTGGIGAGKSFVAEILRKKGIPVIDMDSLGREITEESPTMIREISKIVGRNVGRDGRLDRSAVRETIFKDPRAKRDLENLLHPIIRREFDDRAEHLEEEGKRLVICEAALLIESGHYKSLDGLIVVLAPRELRKRRLVERDRISAELADSMIDSQIDDATRRQHATHVLHNDGDTSRIYEQVETLVQGWREDGLL